MNQPDDGDDRVQKKSENVAHVPDGIKLKKLKNSGRLRNSPTRRHDEYDFTAEMSHILLDESDDWSLTLNDVYGK